ncbi:MAG TPA: hypothetical protein DCE41_26180 [Cytophagales bacterium]|nr:hypothetical protein [Cytophagales bacterium]HAA22427.1 hypothetical protein [Cytophagales bacterium]HAP62306.1 hypothetical protein [Cytophagales bacterium]
MMLKLLFLFLAVPCQEIPSPDTLFISSKEEFYRLDSLLEHHSHIEELTIAAHGNYDIWILYDGPRDANTWPLFKYPVHLTSLSDQFLEFRNLKYLNIGFLGLTTLPKDMSSLENLEVLDLSFNYLDYASTITALKSLPRLEKVITHGNLWENAETEALQKQFPDLEIVSVRVAYREYSQEIIEGKK